MTSDGLVSMISGELFDKLVGLSAHTLYSMTLTSSRKRSRDALDSMRGHLGASRLIKPA